ncbi:MAG: hypothetical protein F2853_00630 [Actinobacteria bacterium]|uniref:Unannotated protein n=1 Tax=freshwater metagenome TaxID=449393 RepID=A0A6J6T4Y1_9ZZZZ|nr:hypothetical protein [Actinomycetota bacterium]MSZ02805.1 hypothetical protein [Actinomycetota bacterium]
MARIKKPELNLILADKLLAWADKYDVANDGYVRGLYDALNSRKNLQVWASLNPIEYLPMPELKAGLSLAKWTRFITVLRNVLVFLPVALTWAAVGQATTAFSIYLKANGSDIVNFLDFWQNGYGVLGEEWRIANVALLDFLIIMVVIVLTLLASVFSRRVSELQVLAEKETDRQRILLSVEIASYLFDKQKVTNVTMNQSLARALDKLLNATDAIEATAKALEKTSKSKGLN